MRLTFASIVAASTLALLSTPSFADGERGGDNRHESQGNHHGGNHINNNRGWHSNNRDRGNYQNNHNRGNDHSSRRDYRHNDRRGTTYWGPSANHWSRWDNNWGDPNRYARQWGFDRYDHNRGWQRGNTWYASPSLWNDWGGWNWSFSWSGSNNFANNGYGQHSGYNQYGHTQCQTYRTEDWVNGRRASVTYLGCVDPYGRIVEQPNTRQFERWLW